MATDQSTTTPLTSQTIDSLSPVRFERNMCRTICITDASPPKQVYSLVCADVVADFQAKKAQRSDPGSALAEGAKVCFVFDEGS